MHLPVGRSVIASPAAKAATCQLLGHSGSRQTCVVSTHIISLRISEALALKWGDVDWLNRRLRVERGIVCQVVDDVKTSESRRELHVDNDMLDTLKLWKQTPEGRR